MCVCCSRASVCISRRKRATSRAVASSGDSTLPTIGRPSECPRATNKRLMPPPPSSRSMTKPAPSLFSIRSMSVFMLPRTDRPDGLPRSDLAGKPAPQHYGVDIPAAEDDADALSSEAVPQLSDGGETHGPGALHKIVRHRDDRPQAVRGLGVGH